MPFYLLLDLRHALRVELVGTALISALGTWLLAGQFTRSAAARTLACLVFVAKGCFALPATTGHLWHLQYYVARDFSQGKKIRFWRDAWPGYAAFFKYRWSGA